MVTNQKNVAAKPATKPAPTAAAAEIKTNIPADSVKIPDIVPADKKPVSLPPIEERLKKLNKIQRLADRRETLLEAIDNLGGFYVTPDGNGCNLRFTDSKGNVFGIAHPTVIGEMVSLAKSKLNAELERIENQIDFTI